VGRYDGLVVLGGPMNVNQTDRYPHLALERDAIRIAADSGLPVLGICLGAQLISVALGGSVSRDSAREIGWVDVSPTADGEQDPLFSHFRRTEKIFQWHGDSFSIPPGAVHLAESKACPTQAFRYGESVYGLQFHLEVDEALIQRWLRIPSHLRELAEAGDETDSRRILDETRKFIHRSEALSRAFFGEFIERFYGWRRRVTLSSR